MIHNTTWHIIQQRNTSIRQPTGIQVDAPTPVVVDTNVDLEIEINLSG